MKVVIIRLNVGNFGMIGTYNVQEVGLAEALIKMGNDVSVLYLNKNVKTIVKDKMYDYVYYLPHVSIGLHGVFNTKILEEFEPERIIMFSDNQLWAKNVINWSYKKKIKCIQYFGGVLSDNPKLLNQMYTKLILKRNFSSYLYSINIAKTKKVQKEMQALQIPCNKIINIGLDESVLNQSFNPEPEIRKLFGFEKNEIILLFVGRLVDYKNPILACDILIELLKRGVKSRLVIIGSGVLEIKLKRYIDENNLTSKVIWKKRVPYEEMYKYMTSCDCYINLSSKEIFGMAILEAMYYGLLVVAHEAPGPNEIIENGVSGYLCSFETAEKWVDQILLALDNKKLLTAAARLRISEKFMWEMNANEFIDI